ncbi:hypothetical protein KC322_g1 [Hortaea werneckii]|nr:hypothetical protein KC322_g1 [Hortaea werneckii]
MEKTYSHLPNPSASPLPSASHAILSSCSKIPQSSHTMDQKIRIPNVLDGGLTRGIDIEEAREEFVEEV